MKKIACLILAFTFCVTYSYGRLLDSVLEPNGDGTFSTNVILPTLSNMNELVNMNSDSFKDELKNYGYVLYDSASNEKPAFQWEMKSVSYGNNFFNVGTQNFIERQIIKTKSHTINSCAFYSKDSYFYKIVVLRLLYTLFEQYDNTKKDVFYKGKHWVAYEINHKTNLLLEFEQQTKSCTILIESTRFIFEAVNWANTTKLNWKNFDLSEVIMTTIADEVAFSKSGERQVQTIHFFDAPLNSLIEPLQLQLVKHEQE